MKHVFCVIALAAFCLFAHPVKAATLTVNKTSGPYTSIASAIASPANPGDTIEVTDNAFYAESFTLNGVNLQTAVGAIINGQITVQGADLTISGFTISNATANQAAVLTPGTGAAGAYSIVQCTLLSTANNNGVVYVQDPCTINITSSTIKNSPNHGVKIAGVADQNTRLNLTGSEIFYCPTNDIQSGSIRLEKPAQVTLRNSRITRSLGHGIHIDTYADAAPNPVADIKLYDTQIRNAARNGIRSERNIKLLLDNSKIIGTIHYAYPSIEGTANATDDKTQNLWTLRDTFIDAPSCTGNNNNALGVYTPTTLVIDRSCITGGNDAISCQSSGGGAQPPFEVTITDSNITGGGGCGIYCVYPLKLIASNSSFGGSGNSPLYRTSANNTTPSEATFTNCALEATNNNGVEFQASGNLTLVNCSLRHNFYRAVFCETNPVLLTMTGCVLVDGRNQAVNSQNICQVGKLANGSKIENNLFEGGYCPLDIYDSGANIVYVNNNTFVGVKASGTGAAPNAYPAAISCKNSAVVAKNNLIYGQGASATFGSRGFYLELNTGQPGSLTCENNLVYNVTTRYATGGTLNPTITMVGTDVNADPLLVSVPNPFQVGWGDYALLTGSPALNAGAVIAGLTNDLEGNAHAATPNIGCFGKVAAAARTAVVTVPSAGIDTLHDAMRAVAANGQIRVSPAYNSAVRHHVPNYQCASIVSHNGTAPAPGATLRSPINIMSSGTATINLSGLNFEKVGYAVRLTTASALTMSNCTVNKAAYAIWLPTTNYTGQIDGAWDETAVAKGPLTLDGCVFSQIGYRAVHLGRMYDVSMNNSTITQVGRYGGIVCDTSIVNGNPSKARFTNSTFSMIKNENHGAIRMAGYSEVTLDNCDISTCTSRYRAGGMYNYRNVRTSYNNCRIYDNVSREYGGGLHFYDDSSPAQVTTHTITNCFFGNNIDNNNTGGGIYTYSNNLRYFTISNTVFEANMAGAYGGGAEGGAFIDDSGSGAYTFQNCVFTSNTGTGNGSAVRINSGPSNANFINCSFNGNRSNGNHQGWRWDALTFWSTNVNANVVNCLFEDSGHAILNNQDNVGQVKAYNCLFGVLGRDGFVNAVACVSLVNPVFGYPQFVWTRPDMLDLKANSAAIDMGADSVAGLAAPTLDILGRSRQRGVDIGAYEFQGAPTPPATPPYQVVRVKPTGGTDPVLFDGSTWAKAMSLATAMANVAPGGQIWMQKNAAPGDYPWTASYVLNKNIGIFGGFDGLNDSETVASRPANYWQSSPTTITITVANQRFVTALNGVYLELDGIGVTGANIAGTGWGNAGGVIYARYLNLVARNCCFYNNKSSLGGVIGSENGSAMDLSNCWFLNNTSLEHESGAIRSYKGNSVMRDCVFRGNASAKSIGGAIMHDGGPTSLTMIGCVVRDNTAVSDAGGVLADGQYLTLVNCVFARNTCNANGGGLRRNGSGRTDIINCAFEGNISNGNIGNTAYPRHSDAILIMDGRQITNIVNCVFDNHEYSIYNYQYAKAMPNVVNCLFGTTGRNGRSNQIMGCTLVNPRYGAVAFADVAARNYALNANSAAINAGASDVAPATDILGAGRVGAVDIGAYEFQGVPSAPTLLLPNIVRATPTGGAPQDGLTWATAMTLDNALAGMNPGGEIWLKADGGYTRAALLEVTKPFSIYGGFEGVDSNPETSATRIANYANVRPTTITMTTTNRFFNVWGTVMTLDGVHFSGGNGGSASWDTTGGFMIGGGMILNLRKCNIYNSRGWAAAALNLSSCFINMDGCAFANGVTTNYEGGVGRFNDSVMYVTNSEFINNISPNAAGALDFYDNGAASSITLISCRFASNRANGNNGGAIRSRNSTPLFLIQNCVFDGNRSSGSGGALSMESGNLTLVDSTVSNNSFGSGGSLYINGPFKMTNCVVAFNTGTGDGGIGRRGGNNQFDVINCTFYKNKSNGVASTGAVLNPTHYNDGWFIDANNANTVRILNSIFDGQDTALYHYNTANTGMIVKNCLFGNHNFNQRISTETVCNAYVAASGALNGPANLTPNLVATDPLFIGASPAVVADLVPASNSPVIAYGLATYAGVTIPAYDILGRVRTYPEATPDSGAFETLRNGLLYTPNPLDFGAVAKNSLTSATVLVTGYNNVPLEITAANFTVPAPYAVTGFSGTLGIGASNQITVEFNPTQAGQYDRILSYADAGVAQSDLPVAGAAFPEVISITRASANPTSAPGMDYLVTFSQPMVNVTADDFALTIVSGSFPGASVGAPISNGDGSSWTIPVIPGTGQGEIRLDVIGAADIADSRYAHLLVNVPITSGEIYIADTLAPTIISLLPQIALTSQTEVLYDLTFSEPVSEVTNANFALITQPGASALFDLIAPGATPSANWQIRVHDMATTAQMGDPFLLRLADPAGITDIQGNAVALPKDGDPVTVDLVPPAVFATEPAQGAATDGIVNVVVTYNEPVIRAAADEVTATSDGAVYFLSTGVASDPTSQILTFDFLDLFVAGRYPVTLAVDNASTRIVDLAGNPALPTSWTITHDTSLISVRLDCSSTSNGDITSKTPILIIATFRRPVQQFVITDLVTTNATVTAVSWPANSAVYTFNLIPTNEGLFEVAIPEGVCNGAFNPYTGSLNGTSNMVWYLFDSIAPQFSAFTATPAFGKAGTTETITFQASEDLMAPPVVTVNGNPAILDLQAGSYYNYQYVIRDDETEGLALISVTGTDLAGNTSTSLNQTVLMVDRVPPTAAFGEVSPDLNALITLTFSEPVTGVDISDFVLTLNGATIPPVTNFTQVTSTVYTVTTANATPGNYRLVLVAGGSGIRDQALNDMVQNAEITWFVARAGSAVRMWTRY